MRVRRALDAAANGGVAHGAARGGRAICVVRAFDAEARFAGVARLRAGARAGLDAAMRGGLAATTAGAVVVGAALDANLQIAVAARSCTAAVVVVRAGDAEASAAVAAKAMALRAVAARLSGGGARVGGLLIEAKGAVACGEHQRANEEERGARHGPARDSASARAKPRGRFFK